MSSLLKLPDKIIIFISLRKTQLVVKAKTKELPEACLSTRLTKLMPIVYVFPPFTIDEFSVLPPKNHTSPRSLDFCPLLLTRRCYSSNSPCFVLQSVVSDFYWIFLVNIQICLRNSSLHPHPLAATAPFSSFP